MNHTHAHYRIHNDEFLFVLWSFIEFPIRWTDRHGRRRMTAHEKQAWFNFWYEIGRRMSLADIPETKAAFDAFVQSYEHKNFVYSKRSARVSDATVRIMENWLPGFMRPVVKPAVCCLMPGQFLDAVGYARPPTWRRRTVENALRVVGLVNRLFALGHYPSVTVKRRQRTYPLGYVIEDMEPVNLTERVCRSDRKAAGESVPEKL